MESRKLPITLPVQFQNNWLRHMPTSAQPVHASDAASLRGWCRIGTIVDQRRESWIAAMGLLWERQYIYMGFRPTWRSRPRNAAGNQNGYPWINRVVLPRSARLLSLAFDPLNPMWMFF
jgi:hypothetical protein